MARKMISVEKLRRTLENSSDDDISSDDSVADPLWSPSESEEDDNTTEDIAAIIRHLQEDEDGEEMVHDEGEVSEAARNEDIGRGNVEWMEYEGRHKTFTFTGKSGLQTDIAGNISPFDAFSLFVDDDVLDFIVRETNRYADQVITSTRTSRHSRLSKWAPTCKDEMKKFLGLLMWMGLNRRSSIQSYWSTKPIYQNNIPANTMSRNRFELLLRMIHFSDNETVQPTNRLCKITPLIDILHTKFQEIFYPDENFVIDETLVPWRGRLVFRQYIPNKAHKYGIKLFKLCSSEGYTWNSKIYAGKSEDYDKTVGLARTVCEDLSQGLLNEGRTLFVDNFYTSYELALSFLQKKTHVVGTVRQNKKNIPKDVVLKKLERGEITAKEDENGIMVMKWRSTRDVRLLSTKHAPTMVESRDRNTPSTSKRARKSTSKPLVVCDYNKGKIGIDISDQMCSYATTLRKGVKWYRKLGIEYLLGICIVNALVVYKTATQKQAKITWFREEITANLLDLPKSAEKRENPTCRNVHVLSTKVDQNNKKVRRMCVLCYANLKKTDGRVAARKKVRQVSTFCHDCENEPFMCLECFGKHHQ